MPKNRQTFHDPLGELAPVTIEILKGDILRFTQVDSSGRTNVVTFSDRLAPGQWRDVGVRAEA
jgi:hypothetical protein